MRGEQKGRLTIVAASRRSHRLLLAAKDALDEVGHGIGAIGGGCVVLRAFAFRLRSGTDVGSSALALASIWRGSHTTCSGHTTALIELRFAVISGNEIIPMVNCNFPAQC
jgi:hypothetical protein